MGWAEAAAKRAWLATVVGRPRLSGNAFRAQCLGFRAQMPRARVAGEGEREYSTSPGSRCSRYLAVYRKSTGVLGRYPGVHKFPSSLSRMIVSVG